MNESKPKMKEGIIKRGKGSYAVVIEDEPDPATGRRRQRWFSYHGDMPGAKKYRTELLHKRDNGVLGKPDKATFGDYLENWLTSYVRPNLAPKTAEIRAQWVHRHIIPSLGRIALTSLKPDHLQDFYTDKLVRGRTDGQGGLSPRTVRDLHGIIHAALKKAVKRGLVVRNVADATDPPSFARHKMQTLKQDGLRTVLEAARGSQYFALFYTLLFTGLRRSEALALRWSDVDLTSTKPTVRITRSMHHMWTGETVFREPKTETSRRAVSLSQSACLVLRQHRDNEEALKGSLASEDLIFCHVDRSPLLPDSVSHAWMKLVRRCGLRGVRLHDARHTHASLMFDQGIPLKVISERLGHSSVKVTSDIYVHPADDVQAAAAARFDEMLQPRTEVKEIQSAR